MTRNRWALVGAALAVVVLVVGGLALNQDGSAAPSAERVVPQTAAVEKGNLSATVSVKGNLTHRAQADGSPYAVVDQAHGTYTGLPAVGDRIECGTVLYRVDDRPVLLLCGSLPAYRDLHLGDSGNDVRQLNQNLHDLGYDLGSPIDPADTQFSVNTQTALGALQRDRGADATGELDLDGAVVLPSALRISAVTGELGAPAQAGEPVLNATSDTPEVQVDLDASQQSDVEVGDRAQITLPGHRSVNGKVDRLGRVAKSPTSSAGSSRPDADPNDASLVAYLDLDDPRPASSLDEAPVRVDITTSGAEAALSVPVTAIVGRSGGGFAVEVVRQGGRRDLVPVELGLFDSAGGRVQVEGALHEGDRVEVPSS